MNIIRLIENNKFVFKQKSKKIKDKNSIERIKSLKIPTSYTDVKISTIARGISVGDELEYADEVTLGRSITNRIPFELSLKS